MTQALQERAAAGTPTGAEIYRLSLEHPGTAALHAFLTRLAEAELARPGLLTFFASMTAFVRHITPGIPALASRLSDALLPVVPYRAHRIAAHVLDASVDEYGLSGTKPHAELLRDFAGYFGLREREIDDPGSAVPAANDLGRAMFAWYRNAPVATALGVHAASEVTGNQEAQGFHRAFLTPPKYGLAPDTPAFAYVATHVEREEDHSADTVVVLDEVLSIRPEDAGEIVQGSRDYMALYERMFTQMRERIFADA